MGALSLPAQLAGFMTELERLTDEAARLGLEDVDNLGPGRFIDRWRMKVAELALGGSPKFLATSYGYAIEQYVTNNIQSLQAKLPSGYVVKAQQTAGGTRPDFVVYAGQQTVAWLDITSARNVGHVLGKNSSGWRDPNRLVAEILYPELNPFKVTSKRDPAALKRTELEKRRLDQELESKKQHYGALIRKSCDQWATDESISLKNDRHVMKLVRRSIARVLLLEDPVEGSSLGLEDVDDEVLPAMAKGLMAFLGQDRSPYITEARAAPIDEVRDYFDLHAKDTGESESLFAAAGRVVAEHCAVM